MVDGGYHDDGDYGDYDGEEEYGTTPYCVRQQDSYNELVGTTAAIEELDNSTGRYRLPAIIGKNTTDSDVDDKLVTTEWPALDSGVNSEQHQILFVSVISKKVKFKAAADEEGCVEVLNFCNCR